MNYLAHFHLSYGDDELMIGALLGDFVKGPLTGAHPPGIEQGIVLHRKIDSFTDRHPEPLTCHRQFDPRFRRFAGIMTDVVFDHFLNIHWQRFHPQPLPEFSEQVFGLLENSNLLEGNARLQADNLSRYDVFVNYQHWETVEAALLRIGQRIRRDNPLDCAGAEMKLHYDELEQTFLNFYPQLQAHATEQRILFAQS